MALYEEYEQFRDPKLNDQEQRALEEAEGRDKSYLFLNQGMQAVEGGFLPKRATEQGVFDLSDVTQTHMRIALDRAAAQFRDLPTMPEDEDISLRFPGVDPVGKFSVIDMKFAQREAAIRAHVEGLGGPVKEFATTVLNNLRGEENSAPFMYEGSKLRGVVERHRLLTRASKLCLSKVGREQLHQQARGLETCAEVVGYDQQLQALEYTCGLRTGPLPQEFVNNNRVSSFLRYDLMELAQAAMYDRPPEVISIDFQNMENKMLQKAFADPHNWGASMESLEFAARDLVDLDKLDVVPPYARATADRVLNPIFERTEGKNSEGLDRGDLIIIDGKTVKEKMLEDYARAQGDPAKFNDFYQKNLRQATNEYTAAALMAGKRVEAFVPDGTGRIPNEPTQLTKTGYEPSPLKPEHFNAWQRFFSKHGYYKEKVARQAEYERMTAARQRVRLKRLGAQANRFSTAYNKELFFGPILEELGFVKETADGQTKYDWDRMGSHMMSDVKSASVFNQFTRSEPMDTCVCYLAAQGYKFRDIMDPNKLQDKRLEAARLFLEKAQTNDTEWLGQVFYDGHKALIGQVRELTDGVDLQNLNALTEVIPEVEGLVHSAFSVSQNLKDSGCTLGYHKAALADAGGDPALASQKANELNDKVNNVSLFAGDMLSGVKALAVLADPSAGLPRTAIAPDLGTMRLALDHMRKGPSIVEKACPFSEMIGFRAASSTSMALTEAVDKLTATPEGRAGVAEAAVNGKLMEQLKVKKFTNEPFKGPDGKPIQNTEQKKVLRLGEDGKYSIAVVESPHIVNNPAVEFKLGEAFTPQAERKGPEAQAKAQQPKAPQRQNKPPQMGGPHR